VIKEVGPQLLTIPPSLFRTTFWSCKGVRVGTHAARTDVQEFLEKFIRRSMLRYTPLLWQGSPRRSTYFVGRSITAGTTVLSKTSSLAATASIYQPLYACQCSALMLVVTCQLSTTDRVKVAALASSPAELPPVCSLLSSDALLVGLD
jgi:hypothetical protein